jgi:hypothetical protein
MPSTRNTRSRSMSSRKIGRRLLPLAVTWYTAPSYSIRCTRAMSGFYPSSRPHTSPNSTSRPLKRNTRADPKAPPKPLKAPSVLLGLNMGIPFGVDNRMVIDCCSHQSWIHLTISVSRLRLPPLLPIASLQSRWRSLLFCDPDRSKGATVPSSRIPSPPRLVLVPLRRLSSGC